MIYGYVKTKPTSYYELTRDNNRIYWKCINKLPNNCGGIYCINLLFSYHYSQIFKINRYDLGVFNLEYHFEDYHLPFRYYHLTWLRPYLITVEFIITVILVITLFVLSPFIYLFCLIILGLKGLCTKLLRTK